MISIRGGASLVHFPYIGMCMCVYTIDVRLLQLNVCIRSCVEKFKIFMEKHKPLTLMFECKEESYQMFLQVNG